MLKKQQGNNYIEEMSSNEYGSPRGVPVRGGGPQKGPKSIFLINGRAAGTDYIFCYSRTKSVGNFFVVISACKCYQRFC